MAGLTRLLCALVGHRAEPLYVTGGGPVRVLRGPFGKRYLEEHICERCGASFWKRVRRKPQPKTGRR